MEYNQTLAVLIDARGVSRCSTASGRPDAARATCRGCLVYIIAYIVCITCTAQCGNTHLSASTSRCAAVQRDTPWRSLLVERRSDILCASTDEHGTLCCGNRASHVRILMENCAARSRKRKHLARNVTHSVGSGGHFATHHQSEESVLTRVRSLEREVHAAGDKRRCQRSVASGASLVERPINAPKSI